MIWNVIKVLLLQQTTDQSIGRDCVRVNLWKIFVNGLWNVDFHVTAASWIIRRFRFRFRSNVVC